jgi:FkbM family methyltransferase
MGPSKVSLLTRVLVNRMNISFSQCGEDLIVNHILSTLNIRQPIYLDIGAYHPVKLNNTYLFYIKGSNGVCVEPDPELFRCLKSKRKRDICLNLGVGPKQKGNANFYVMSSKTLSSFSKEDAERYQSYGKERIVKVLQLPLVSINDVLQNYFKRCPDFVSLDAEGVDFQILKSFDFSKHRPPVFCIETLTYTEDNSERKLLEINEYMHENSYKAYADTYINSIFVDSMQWKQRRLWAS